jgi:hypothetical protein
MKKQYFKINITLIMYTLSVLTFSTCTTLHSGLITGNAALSQNNFRYAGKLSTSNINTYVFGVGGNEKANQIEQLRMQLIKQYPLRDGLAWANVGVTYRKNIFLPFIWTSEATLTLDVIDFWPDTNTVYKNYLGYYLNDSTYIYTGAVREKKGIDIISLRSTLQPNDTIFNKLFIAEIKLNKGELITEKLNDNHYKENMLILFKYDNTVIPGIILSASADINYIAVRFLNANRTLTSEEINFGAVLGAVKN